MIKKEKEITRYYQVLFGLCLTSDEYSGEEDYMGLDLEAGFEIWCGRQKMEYIINFTLAWSKRRVRGA